MFRVSIPTPCHEDWNKMNPVDQGRHCNVCAKTVVDFTSMSDEEVKNYLINKKDEHPCGRFKASQLHRMKIELPHNIFQIAMPWWKRFLVASLIVFSSTLFSCDVQTLGVPVEKVTKEKQSERDESIDKLGGMVGGLVVIWDSTYENIVDTPVDVLMDVLPDTTLPYPTDSTEYILSGVPVYGPDSIIDEHVVPVEEIQVIDTIVDNCDEPPV